MIREHVLPRSGLKLYVDTTKAERHMKGAIVVQGNPDEFITEALWRVFHDFQLDKEVQDGECATR